MLLRCSGILNRQQVQALAAAPVHHLRHHLHLQVSVLGIGGAIYGGRKQHTVGLFGVEYVGYAFIDGVMNRF